MQIIRKISKVILQVEELLAAAMLCIIAVLVFLSAIARTIGHPLNWAQDISLLLFAWLTFIGSDVVIRHGHLIRIDMIFNKFPKVMRRTLNVIYDALIIVFLVVLVIFGFRLVSQSWNRVFNTLPLSYAWCTLSVPVGSLLMVFTLVCKIVLDLTGIDMLGTYDSKEEN